MINIESKYEEINPSVESTFEKIKEGNDYTSINIERTSDFCKEAFNIDKNQEEVCNSLNNNFTIGLEEQNIDFDALLKQKIA